MKRFHTRIPPAVQKTRLDQFLSEWLPHVLSKPLSKSAIRTLLLSGSVYVNRHRVKSGPTPLFSGSVIEVYYDEARIFPNRTSVAVPERLETSRILFEDEWLLVIDKPPGLPTQPTLDPLRPNLFDLTKSFLRAREKNENAYVGLHHRLDRDTSGLVLFTKKESANAGVSALFSEHRIEKTYHCISWRTNGSAPGAPGETFVVDDFLGKTGTRNKKALWGRVSHGGDRAITEFRVVEGFRSACWFEARPKTGRTHQIRVHSSGMGYPILGDELYFPGSVIPIFPAPRLMLHAIRLEFMHPMTGREVRVESDLPREFVDYLGLIRS
jgi:RluA family pseudouridine synthase